MAGVKKKEDDAACGGNGVEAAIQCYEPDSCEGEDDTQQDGMVNRRLPCAADSEFAKRTGYFKPKDLKLVAELYRRVQEEKVLPLACVADRRGKSSTFGTPVTESTEAESIPSDEDTDRAAKSTILGKRGPRRLKTYGASPRLAQQQAHAPSRSVSSPGDYDFQFQDDFGAEQRGAGRAPGSTSLARLSKHRRASRKSKAALENVLSTVWRQGQLESDLNRTAGDNETAAAAEAQQATSIKRRHSSCRSKSDDGDDAEDPFTMEKSPAGVGPSLGGLTNDVASDGLSPTKDRRVTFRTSGISPVPGKLDFG